MMTSKQASVSDEMTSAKKQQPMKAEDRYKSMDHVEHVYNRPTMYLGQMAVDTDNEMWVYNDSIQRMELMAVPVSPAFLKCWNELASNIYDHARRMADFSGKPVRRIEFHTVIDPVYGHGYRFFNDGDGILLEYMQKHRMYPPELIFGTLLTSSNYDKDVDRSGGGLNGMGAKLTNIFGKKFSVTTICAVTKRKFTKHWYDNMSRADPAIVLDASELECTDPHTVIDWYPDWVKFGMTPTDALAKLLAKNAIDIVASLDDHAVTAVIDNVTIPSSRLVDFKNYARLYVGPDRPMFYVDEHHGWQVAICPSESGQYEQISFTNGVLTSDGGKHMDYLLDVLCGSIIDLVKARDKVDLRPYQIRNMLFLCVNMNRLKNPDWDAQTKKRLTSPSVSELKTTMKFELSANMVKAICSEPAIAAKLAALRKSKEMLEASATDGSKINRRLIEIEGLDDANLAGSSQSKNCQLAIVEGLSAKTAVVSGLSCLPPEERDRWGIWPISGKPINVRNCTRKQLMNNPIVNKLKMVLGLELCKVYTPATLSKLRYGSVYLITDQDNDGLHIKGLMLNMFMMLWPSLVQLGYVKCLMTPLIVVNLKKSKQRLRFYSKSALDAWRAKPGNADSIKNIKYYKELGTSDADEAKEWFRNKHVTVYKPDPVPPPTELPPEVDVAQEKKDESDRAKNGDDTLTFVPSDSDMSLLSLIVPDSSKTITSSSASKRRRLSAKSAPVDLENSLFAGSSKERRQEALDMPFNRKRANDRKEWLLNSYSNTDAMLESGTCLLSEFVEFMKKYSMCSNERSVPSMVDGLKPSQRKVCHTVFKNKPSDEVKVRQLSGMVSNQTDYHHGENSLDLCIVNQAQDYVGSNNIPILLPRGQFGTRLNGGDDHADPRYIHIAVNPIATTIFNPLDEKFCTYNLDDHGKKIEPKYFYTIVPLILINGAYGIGTGFRTDIPTFNPLDVTAGIRYLLSELNKGRMLSELSTADVPMIRLFHMGFKGTYIRTQKRSTTGNESSCYRWYSRGKYEIIDDSDDQEVTLRVTELPVKVWTSRFVRHIDDHTIGLRDEMEKTQHKMQLVGAVTDDSGNKVKKGKKPAGGNDSAGKSKSQSTTGKRKRKAEGGDTTGGDANGNVDESGPTSRGADDSGDLECLGDPFVIRFTPRNTERSVDSTLVISRKTYNQLNQVVGPDDVTLLEKRLMLAKPITMGLFWLHDETGRLHHYESAEDILVSWFKVRYPVYEKRYKSLIGALPKQKVLLEAKCRFIQEVNDGLIDIKSKTRSEIAVILAERGYPRDTKNNDECDSDDSQQRENHNINDADGEQSIDSADGSYLEYAYLTDLPISSLIRENIPLVQKKLQRVTDQLDILLAKNASILWLEDLDVFDKQYEEYKNSILQLYESSVENGSFGPTEQLGAKKRGVKKAVAAKTAASTAGRAKKKVGV